MPCDPEHLKKLDAMLDSIFKGDNSSVMTSPSHSKEKDCKPFSDTPEREELRQGALSKEQ
jgi:hypothetical protein